MPHYHDVLYVNRFLFQLLVFAKQKFPSSSPFPPNQDIMLKHPNYAEISGIIQTTLYELPRCGVLCSGLVDCWVWNKFNRVIELNVFNFLIGGQSKCLAPTLFHIGGAIDLAISLPDWLPQIEICFRHDQFSLIIFKRQHSLFTLTKTFWLQWGHSRVTQ